MEYVLYDLQIEMIISKKELYFICKEKCREVDFLNTKSRNVIDINFVTFKQDIYQF